MNRSRRRPSCTNDTNDRPREATYKLADILVYTKDRGRKERRRWVNNEIKTWTVSREASHPLWLYKHVTKEWTRSIGLNGADRVRKASYLGHFGPTRSILWPFTEWPATLRGGQFHIDVHGGMKMFANEHCSACIRDINGTVVVSVCVFQGGVSFRTVNLINSKVELLINSEKLNCSENFSLILNSESSTSIRRNYTRVSV